MSIAPVTASVRVPLPPDTAFDLFTRRIGEWWQRQKSIAPKPWAQIVIEPGAGGRWFERDADGAETDWGDVLAWEPPCRLLLAWRIDANFRYDPAFETEVELRFTPVGQRETLVSLEHRNLERFGADAERVAGNLGGGWPTLITLYGDLARKEKEA
jgi:hypothetical protein